MATRRWLFICVSVVLLAGAVVSVLSSWDFLLKPGKSREHGGTQDIGITELKPTEWSESLQVHNQQGQSISLRQIVSNGKWTVVHFWATWCEACREELVAIAQFRSKQPEFAVVQVSVDFRWDEVSPYLSKLGLTLTSFDFIDGGGKVARKIGTEKFPESYLVDPRGNPRLHLIGAQPWADPQFTQMLSAYIAQGNTGTDHSGSGAVVNPHSESEQP